VRPADRASLWQRIELRFGLTPSMLPSDQLEVAVTELARRGHLREGEYLTALGDAELRALAERVTVGETFFLRHAEQLEAALQHLLGLGRPVRALSLGCSTGEEPYSLAMIWLDGAPGRAAHLQIDAVDLSEAALEKARAGVYGEWALRALPEGLRARWFRRRRNRWHLADEVRHMVRFATANLADPLDGVWSRGPYDVVLCRNVLMYFAPEAARAVMARIVRLLAPDGLLMLGHAESVRGLSDELVVQQREGAFVFARRAPSPSAAAKPIRSAPRPPPSEASDGPVANAAAPGVEEAVAALDHGDLAAARAAANTLLSRAAPADGAAAHHILGLCAEADGDVALAIREHTRAATADPGLADAWLHLGRLQRRHGALASARNALERARLLLEREPAWRIQTWAPGFDRSSLLALVDAELAACRRPA
jgi:chemotaxis protein methyltransferase CheR